MTINVCGIPFEVEEVDVIDEELEGVIRSRAAVPDYGSKRTQVHRQSVAIHKAQSDLHSQVHKCRGRRQRFLADKTRPHSETVARIDRI